MPQVPQYDRQVAPKNTPLPYMNLNSEGAFGETVYKAQANFGAALGNITDSLDKIQTRIDNTKLVELTNKTNEWEQTNLYDKENGYLYKSGKDAYGQSQNLLQDYDKFMSDYISKSNLRPEAKQKAMATVSSMRNRISQTVTAHDYKQGVVWSNTEGDSAKEYYMSNAINMRNNPDEIAKSLMSGYQIIEWQGEIQNKDDAQIRADKIKFRSDLHQGVLNSLIADGSLKAGEYLEQHKSEIDPNKLPQYISAVKNNEINYTARNMAVGLIASSPEDAYKFIDNIEDISLRNATESEYNRLLRHQQEMQNQVDAKISNEIMQKYFYAYENGDDVSAIMRDVNASNMSLEQKEKIYKNIKTMQELQGIGNNWADYNILLDMAVFDNEKFKTINPANYNLTKEQFNSITEMQRKAVNNEYTPEVELRKAIKGMYNPKFNIQGKNGLHQNEYEDEVIKFLSTVERLQGEAFDLNNSYQLQSIMSAFDYKDKNAANKNIDETKELFMRAKKDGEAYKLMAQEYMYFKSINKREPSAEEIHDMAKRTYNTIENMHIVKNKEKLTNAQVIYERVNSTVPKKGETKVLTYYADVRIPQISRELGIPLKVTSRYRAGDKGNHGKGIKCDVGMSALNYAQRLRVFERMLSDPAVASIGTSDAVILKRYNNPPHPKIRDLREYDSNYKKSHPNTTMNHVNHIDISFDTRFGGNTQG